MVFTGGHAKLQLLVPAGAGTRRVPMIACSFRNRWFAVCATLLTLVAGPVAASEPVAARSKTLVIGRISDNPRSDVQRLRPLLDYVLPKLKAVGIEKGEILLARNPVQLRNYLRRGRVDWVTETAAMAAMLGADAGATMILRGMREHEGAYHSVMFVRRDSGIENIEQLLGKRIALQMRSSTSSFYLPLLMLHEAGLPIVELASPEDAPRINEIGFVMARSERNIATWVEKGLADAGAFSNLDWGDPLRMPESFRNQMRLIAQSENVPRAVELVAADLRPEVRNALVKALLAAGDDPQADAAMRTYFGTTRFVRIDPESAQKLDKLGSQVLALRRRVE